MIYLATTGLAGGGGSTTRFLPLAMSAILYLIAYFYKYKLLVTSQIISKWNVSRKNSIPNLQPQTYNSQLEIQDKRLY